MNVLTKRREQPQSDAPIHQLTDDATFRTQRENLDRLIAREKEALQRLLEMESPITSGKAERRTDPSAVDIRAAELLGDAAPRPSQYWEDLDKLRAEHAALKRAILLGEQTLGKLGQTLAVEIQRNEAGELAAADSAILLAVERLHDAVRARRALGESLTRRAGIPQRNSWIEFLLAPANVWGWGIRDVLLLRTFKELMAHAAEIPAVQDTAKQILRRLKDAA